MKPCLDQSCARVRRKGLHIYGAEPAYAAHCGPNENTRQCAVEGRRKGVGLLFYIFVFVRGVICNIGRLLVIHIPYLRWCISGVKGGRFVAFVGAVILDLTESEDGQTLAFVTAK